MTKVASGIFFLRAAFPTPLMLITTDAINRIVSPLLMLPYQKYYYGFMKSNENLIEASVAANLILEIPYLVSFSLLAIYFGIIEYLDLPITYLTFVIPFVFFGFFILLMNRISKIKIDWIYIKSYTIYSFIYLFLYYECTNQHKNGWRN